MDEIADARGAGRRLLGTEQIAAQLGQQQSEQGVPMDQDELEQLTGGLHQPQVELLGQLVCEGRRNCTSSERMDWAKTGSACEIGALM
ncbi:MAG TPA: hypothetical protein VKE41_09330 [Roseiflexaceae bacterium]|nr:hypothetical protein [Roseiflexaceae bacterium]